ncbi:MAG: tRNA (adenosine(37)-N6)-threonylcarbamoyltransferase complex ATPase subunit type 1 TsaE [Anaerovoracaceae bacterium]|jgi:tRNA threonylcarbamoyladenosine biosynthesis protein TsaE|nr:tRNA (adenosine(37)-N6)-threonylcarbamoyltransferase complex ATPase subunit type 1 TsaE [Anaerovoracaceae bacterium]
MKEIKREIRINSEYETRQFGEALARELKPGDILALVGDLGTGKTTLTKYIARELGIMQAITSPTFTIICEYTDGRLPLYHFDVYRLNSADEMLELGYEEYFFGDGVCIIEWADKIEELLPENTKTIYITYDEKKPGEGPGRDYAKGAAPDAQQSRVYRCDF